MRCAMALVWPSMRALEPPLPWQPRPSASLAWFVSRSSESLIFGRAGFIARSDLDPVSANLALDFRVEVWFCDWCQSWIGFMADFLPVDLMITSAVSQLEVDLLIAVQTVGRFPMRDLIWFLLLLCLFIDFFFLKVSSANFWLGWTIYAPLHLAMMWSFGSCN